MMHILVAHGCHNPVALGRYIYEMYREKSVSGTIVDRNGLSNIVISGNFPDEVGGISIIDLSTDDVTDRIYLEVDFSPSSIIYCFDEGVHEDIRVIFEHICDAGKFDYGYAYSHVGSVSDSTDEIILSGLGHNSDIFDLGDEIWRDAIAEEKYKHGAIRRIYPLNLLNKSHSVLLSAFPGGVGEVSQLGTDRFVVSFSEHSFKIVQRIDLVHQLSLDA